MIQIESRPFPFYIMTTEKRRDCAFVYPKAQMYLGVLSWLNCIQININRYGAYGTPKSMLSIRSGDYA